VLPAVTPLRLRPRVAFELTELVFRAAVAADTDEHCERGEDSPTDPASIAASATLSSSTDLLCFLLGVKEDVFAGGVSSVPFAVREGRANCKE